MVLYSYSPHHIRVDSECLNIMFEFILVIKVLNQNFLFFNPIQIKFSADCRGLSVHGLP